jgi:hypothetical protein
MVTTGDLSHLYGASVQLPFETTSTKGVPNTTTFESTVKIGASTTAANNVYKDLVTVDSGCSFTMTGNNELGVVTKSSSEESQG